MSEYNKASCPTPALNSPLEQAGLPENVLKKGRFMVIPFNFELSGDEKTDSYRIPTNFDFWLTFINAYYDRDFYFLIRDDFRSEDLMVAPVRASLSAGDARLPFILPRPHVFNGGTTITIQVSDTLTGTPPTNTIQIALIGYKTTRTRY